MSDLDLVRRRTLARQAGRTVARIDTRTTVGIAGAESVAELAVVQADSLTYVGNRAMQNVALLSQMEQQLALNVPAASGRLAAIADMTALSMAGIVVDAAAKLRRI